METMTTHSSIETYFKVIDLIKTTGIRPKNAGLGGRSKYFVFSTKEGKLISIRVSDHYANDNNNIMCNEYHDIMTIDQATEIVSRITVIDTGIKSPFGGNYVEYLFN